MYQEAEGRRCRPNVKARASRDLVGRGRSRCDVQNPSPVSRCVVDIKNELMRRSSLPFFALKMALQNHTSPSPLSSYNSNQRHRPEPYPDLLAAVTSLLLLFIRLTSMLRRSIPMLFSRTSSRLGLVPMVIDSSPKGERAYDIYSRLLRERIVCLHGPVTEEVRNY